MACTPIRYWLDCWAGICEQKRAGCPAMPKVHARRAPSSQSKLPIKPIHVRSYSLQMDSTEMRISFATLFQLALFRWQAASPRGICTPVTPIRLRVHKMEPVRYRLHFCTVTCAWEWAMLMDGILLVVNSA